MKSDAYNEDRVISLGPQLPPIPERLLLAHARGEVLFICGAGVSIPAGLPDFRQLALDVYKALDKAVFDILIKLPKGACNLWEADLRSLTNMQSAEVRRFLSGDYDVVFGMLERRLDNKSREDSRVRGEIVKQLRNAGSKPAAIHKTILKLADRGGAHTLITTNFDLLFQLAARHMRIKVETYSLGGIPRPMKQRDFSGILHIHGALDRNPARKSELVISDQDFGEFYLRRRVVPDFIYDAARLFHLVLIGYSANDPPMRYLLNAVAADGTRFDDLKERFTFIGAEKVDPISIEDWKARGITPMHYDSHNDHEVLAETLQKWAEFSAINGKSTKIDAELRRIVKTNRSTSTDSDRDMFDHLFRRSNSSERTRLSKVVSVANADFAWLDAIRSVLSERERGRSS